MMITSILTVLFSLVAVDGLIEMSGGIDVGVDRSGSDIRNMPISLDDASQASDCQLLCANRRACESWAYVSCGSPLCWLKYIVPPKTEHSCRVVLLA